MISPTITQTRRAAELVLHYDKTVAQAARILGCSVPVIQKCIQYHLDRCPADGTGPPFVSVILADEPTTSSAEADSSFASDPLADEPTTLSAEVAPSFASVPLDDEPTVPSPTVIPLDILTPKGLTLRLQLTSLQDVVTLLQSLEAVPC